MPMIQPQARVLRCDVGDALLVWRQGP